MFTDKTRSKRQTQSSNNEQVPGSNHDKNKDSSNKENNSQTTPKTENDRIEESMPSIAKKLCSPGWYCVVIGKTTIV